MNGRRASMHDAVRLRSLIRSMIAAETAHLGTLKLPGVVDAIMQNGSKYYADVYINGNSPKFQDNFSDFSKWTTVLGSFTTPNNTAVSGGASQDLAIATGTDFGDCTFVCQVYAENQVDEMEIIIRYQDQNNYYALVYSNGSFFIRLVSGGTKSTLASVSVSLLSQTWYYFRFRGQGTTLIGWLSQTGAAGSWTNQVSVSDSTFLRGSVGIGDLSQSAWFQNPTVYPGITPSIPVRPGVGSTLSIGQEVWVEKVNFNASDLVVDMPRII